MWQIISIKQYLLSLLIRKWFCTDHIICFAFDFVGNLYLNNLIYLLLSDNLNLLTRLSAILHITNDNKILAIAPIKQAKISISL